MPKNPESEVPVVMVTGLGTIFESFQRMIFYLVKRVPLIYIETREKRSSQIEGTTSFTVETQSQDIVNVVDYFNLDDNGYFLMGYSLGATIIAHSYNNLRKGPKGIIFLNPTPVFSYPKWSLFLIRSFGSGLYFATRPIAKWYLSHFYINKKEDPEMAVISSKVLDNANPKKLRQAILDIAGYEVWDSLKTINCRTLIVAASKDGFHNQDEIGRMIQMLSASEFLDMETNLRLHSIEMGEIAFRFFQKLSGK
jgi:pimeloyl-ACP methyl ester carboxylesterase